LHPEDTKDAWIKIEDVPAFAESAYVLRAGLAKAVYGFGETRMGI